jgi:hypothetical protein
MKTATTITGFAAALSLFSTFIMKMLHLPGANQLAFFAGLCTAAFASVLVLMQMSRTRSQGYLAAASTFTLLTGVLFKFFHLPGAAVLLTSGIVIIAVISLPGLAYQQIAKTSSRRYAIVISCVASSASLYLLGLLFKIMHWPGANVMMVLSGPILLFGSFFPYLLDRTITKSERQIVLRRAFLVVIAANLLGAAILADLQSTRENSHADRHEIEGGAPLYVNR